MATQQTERFNGASLTVRLLERQGISCVAGIPGGAILPFYRALADSTSIYHVLARHEQGAGFMAQGMARTTGEAAVCIATSGPGATNLVTAIADARLDSIPLVAITGQVPQALIGTDAFQEIDTYGMSIPLTKHNFLVSSARELLEVIPRAFEIALSGRPGPVLVDIPKDVQLEAIEIDADSWPLPGKAKPHPKSDEAAVAEAVAMIKAAARPILYLGGGVIHSEAAYEARTLVEQCNLPTVMTLMALGALPIDHPLSLGMLGMHGSRSTNMALDECDLLIAVGARFDDRATGKVSAFCPQAKIIHVDIDAAEFNKIKTSHLAIRGNVKEVLVAMIEGLGAQDRATWVSRINHLRAENPPARPGLGNLFTPHGLIAGVAALVDDEAVISTDVGQHQMWVAQSYPFRRPRQWLTSGGLGSMGFGLPAAMGAALAEPHRISVCFSGDGSILMNIQEMATAVEEGLNLKLVLMNNEALGLVVQQQTLFYDNRIFASRYKRMPDFAAIAKGFGWEAFDLGSAADPEAMLKLAFETPGPVLIHVPIATENQVLPMVAPGAANTEMIGD